MHLLILLNASQLAERKPIKCYNFMFVSIVAFSNTDPYTNKFSFFFVGNFSRAISAWYDSREWFNSLCKHVMEQDWSWNRPALDYLELYHAARK